LKKLIATVERKVRDKIIVIIALCNTAMNLYNPRFSK